MKNKLKRNYFVKIYIIVLFSLFLLACAARQSVKETIEKSQIKLSDQNLKEVPKPTSPHEQKKGHHWLQLDNGNYIEYLQIGNQGEKIIFLAGILDDSIVTFSNIPELINNANKGLCQLYFLNLPGNGYSSIPDQNIFNPIFLRLCLEQFIKKKGLKDFTLIGNSNGCLVSVLLALNENNGKDYRIKNILGFNPLLKEISFWEMDKYQILLMKTPSAMVQHLVQSPIIGYQIARFTLGSVENKWPWNVEKSHIDSFYNRLSENNRCGIWSSYLKNTLKIMPELKMICNEGYHNITQLATTVILYSNPGDNWVPYNHVKDVAKKMNVKCKILGNGHIPQRTDSKLVEQEILTILKL